MEITDTSLAYLEGLILELDGLCHNIGHVAYGIEEIKKDLMESSTKPVRIWGLKLEFLRRDAKEIERKFAKLERDIAKVSLIPNLTESDKEAFYRYTFSFGWGYGVSGWGKNTYWEDDNPEFNKTIDEIIDIGNDGITWEFAKFGDLIGYLPDEVAEAGLSSNLRLVDENTAEYSLIFTRKLTKEEIDQVADWIAGQMSDGWGEGFEQRSLLKWDKEMKLPKVYEKDKNGNPYGKDADTVEYNLYVSFNTWNSTTEHCVKFVSEEEFTFKEDSGDDRE